jgi:hypothetical protein
LHSSCAERDFLDTIILFFITHNAPLPPPQLLLFFEPKFINLSVAQIANFRIGCFFPRLPAQGCHLFSWCNLPKRGKYFT